MAVLEKRARKMYGPEGDEEETAGY